MHNLILICDILIYWYINISIYWYIDIVINWYWYIGIDIFINVCLILKIKFILYNMTMMLIHHAHWCSQPQNMTLIHQSMMSHQPDDTKYKICCQYAEMLINILNHPIKIKHLASWRPFIIQGSVISPMTLNLKYVVIMQRRSIIFRTIRSK